MTDETDDKSDQYSAEIDLFKSRGLDAPDLDKMESEAKERRSDDNETEVSTDHSAERSMFDRYDMEIPDIEELTDSEFSASEFNRMPEEYYDPEWPPQDVRSELDTPEERRQYAKQAWGWSETRMKHYEQYAEQAGIAGW